MPPAALIPIAIGAGTAAVGAIGQHNAQQQAERTAQQQREEAQQEQQRLEEKYGLTPGELDREQRTFDLEKQQQEDLTKRAGMSGEDLLRQNGQISGTLLDQIQKRQGMTGTDLFLQEGGQPAQDYYNRVTAPGVSDTFAPELELARQQVNAEANRRGVFGGSPEGGIRFEQLGRAGVDLAIKSAREKMAQQQALTSAIIGQSTNARADAANVGAQGISAADRARQELQQFLGNQQNLTASAKGREAQVAVGASGNAQNASNQSYGYQQDLLGQQIGQGQSLQQSGFNLIGQQIPTDIFGQTSTQQTSIPNNSAVNFTDPYGQYQPGQQNNLRITGNASGRPDYLQDEYSNIRSRRY